MTPVTSPAVRAAAAEKAAAARAALDRAGDAYNEALSAWGEARSELRKLGIADRLHRMRP